MEKHSIDHLINNLKTNSLNSRELDALIELLKDDRGEMESYFSEKWHEQENLNTEQKDDPLLVQIHKQINSESTLNLVDQPLRKNMMPSLLKYAAVFVLAIGSVLLWNYVSNNYESQHNGLLKQNEIAVAYGSKSRIVLPDGSVVNLNSGSKIRYASNFEQNRKIYLVGEAFFNVKKDPDHPFLVHTSDITVRVLGTVFNVKSYPEENIIETTLLSGSVQIFGKDMDDRHPGKEITLLKPNEKAVFFKNGTIELKKEEFSKGLERVIPAKGIKIESQVKTEIITAWKNNQLVFNNEKFETLIPKLERWFNVEIENKDVELNNNRLTGKFDQETLEQAMEALKITTPFRYKIEKNRLTIMK